MKFKKYYFEITDDEKETMLISTVSTSLEQAKKSIAKNILCPVDSLIQRGSELFTPFDVQRVKNDYYGNPRYIVHFLDFVSSKEKENATFDFGHKEIRKIAHKRANKLGFSKYRAKNIGGFYVCQWYSNTYELCEMIMNERGEPYETTATA